MELSIKPVDIVLLHGQVTQCCGLIDKNFNHFIGFLILFVCPLFVFLFNEAYPLVLFDAEAQDVMKEID